MPTFYNYTQNGLIYSFDDVFVPADAFRDGNLWTWGLSTYNQLGTGGINRSIPVNVGGANWKQVEGGYGHTAAVKTDGTLWTWGRNDYGSLGININPSIVNGRTTPVTTFAGGTNWKQVSCGEHHTAAIKTDGTLWIWGYNGQGQVGINRPDTSITLPVTTFAGGTNWEQVSCGYRFTAAIKTDGTLWTWGSNIDAQLGINLAGTANGNRSTPVTTFAGGTNWKQVSCTISIAAIKTDGTLWTWGSNIEGQLGINLAGGTLSRICTPVTTFAGGNNWKQVSCGKEHMAATKTDATLWTWGSNGRFITATGQLANNSFNSLTPITTFAGGNNWKQVACGGYHTSAVKTNGTLWTWGSNASGQLGDNTVINKSTPVTTFAVTGVDLLITVLSPS